MKKRRAMVRLITLPSDLVAVEPDDLSGSLVMHSPALVTTQVTGNGHGPGVEKKRTSEKATCEQRYCSLQAIAQSQQKQVIELTDTLVLSAARLEHATSDQAAEGPRELVSDQGMLSLHNQRRQLESTAPMG